MKTCVPLALLVTGIVHVLGNKDTLKSSSLSIQETTITKINSETLPGNLLPGFLFMQGDIEGGSVGVTIGGGRGEALPFLPDDSCHDDIFEGAMEDMRSPQLPYLTQDLWTCDRKEEEIPAWIMETDDLKVTITPQYSGKIWAIYDKKRQREWLFNNRAHQPANIGALKSWASGGCEFNWSPGIIGHSAFSETQVYMARIDTERGPMLRIYEFDRYNGTVFQVDMIVGNSSVLVHPKITNPTNSDLRGYWWTCVAVEATENTRILAPATRVAQTSREDTQRSGVKMRDSVWPHYAMAIENASFVGYEGKYPTDNSFIGNHQLGDMFLRIPDDQVYTPYIAHTELDGFVLVHGHPLNGTKFFTWGQSGPGRFMQDFLAAGGKGNGYYTELQTGPAPSQMQTVPMPANSNLEWTEWFKAFDGSSDVLRGADYQKALGEVDAWMKSGEGMPKESVDDWDAFFQAHSSDAPSEILVTGQPWGALEEKRLGHQLAPGLTFTLPLEGQANYDEVTPWVELLDTGKFSEATLSRLPLSYQTTDVWYDVITRSAESSSGMTWLHALHIGVNMAERGEVEQPIKYFTQSVELKENPIALRCLAVLSQTYEEAWDFYMQAWNSLFKDYEQDATFDRLTANFVTEISFFLQQMQWFDTMEWFLGEVPEEHRNLDAYVAMQTKYFLYKAQYDSAASLLSKSCFPTYAKARTDLADMWFSAQEGLALQAKRTQTNDNEATLTNVEKHQNRVQNPPPDNIGCQYAAEYCTWYW